MTCILCSNPFQWCCPSQRVTAYGYCQIVVEQRDWIEKNSGFHPFECTERRAPNVLPLNAHDPPLVKYINAMHLRKNGRWYRIFGDGGVWDRGQSAQGAMQSPEKRMTRRCRSLLRNAYTSDRLGIVE
jgi:hypothetical protein